jgi:hypothetical protein
MDTKKTSDGTLFKFLIAVMVLMFIRSYNMKRNKKTARTMEYSDSNDYAHISPMKHDIYKTMTVDIAPLLIFSVVTSKTFFSVEEFQSSVIGKSLISVVGLMVYYQVVQPYFVYSKLIPC